MQRIYLHWVLDMSFKLTVVLITPIQKRKFDKDLEKINELLDYGLSGRKIAKALGYTRHIAINNHIKNRSLRIQRDN